MDGLVEEYFSNIFAMSSFDDILVVYYPHAMTEDMNAGLNQDYTVDEVVNSTALGLDGMSPIFYKSFCHIVGGYGCFGSFEYKFYS